MIDAIYYMTLKFFVKFCVFGVKTLTVCEICEFVMSVIS